MSKHEYAPNGVSFDQIKKYAKRLKKESHLTNQQALNQKTKELTDFNCWEDLVEYNKKRGGCLSKFKKDDSTRVIYADKPVYLLDFLVGSGSKTLVLKKTNTNKMLYITAPSIVPQIKKDIQLLGLNPDNVIIQTINDVYKNGINESDFDMIVLDEFHISSMSIKSMEICYKFVVKNKVLIYQFFNLNVRDLLINPKYNTNHLRKYIANDDKFLDSFHYFWSLMALQHFLF